MQHLKDSSGPAFKPIISMQMDCILNSMTKRTKLLFNVQDVEEERSRAKDVKFNHTHVFKHVSLWI